MGLISCVGGFGEAVVGGLVLGDFGRLLQSAPNHYLYNFNSCVRYFYR